MTRYREKAYCSLCQKWYTKDELLKVYIPKLNVYSFYCKYHKKQVRLKSRGTPMHEPKMF